MIPEIKSKHLIACTMCNDTLEVLRARDVAQVLQHHMRQHGKTNRYHDDTAMSVTIIYERPHEGQELGWGAPVGRMLELAVEKDLQ